MNPDEVDHLLLAIRDGKPIYLSDIAKVRDSFKDRTSYSRLNGQANVTLSVVKRVGANVVQISDYVKHIVAEAEKRLPSAVSFDITFDMSIMIRNMVADLENDILTALIMVTSVLLIFLGWVPAPSWP